MPPERTLRRRPSSRRVSLLRSRGRVTARLGTVPTPRFLAYDTARSMPTVSSTRTAARLLDVRSAVLHRHGRRRRMFVFREPGALVRRRWARFRRSITVAGEYPFSIAAAYTNGLKAEPGWRFDCSARFRPTLVMSRPTDDCADFSGAGIERDERRLQRFVALRECGAGTTSRRTLTDARFDLAANSPLRLLPLSACRDRPWCRRACDPDRPPPFQTAR